MSTSIFKRLIFCTPLIFLWLTAPAMGAEVHLQDLIPGTKYYFDDFNPNRKPWVPGEFRNIEEVFKNYQYVEIVLDADGRTITVKQYIQSVSKDVAKYRISPAGELQKEQ